MSQRKLGPEPAEEVATPADVYAAVAALSVAALLRLRGFAVFKVLVLGTAGFGLDPEEVVQEAVLRTVNGDRTWRKGAVDFVGHLRGVISSLTSHWGEKVERRAPTLTAADLPRPDGPDEQEDPLESWGDGAPTPERAAAAREMLEQVERLFADDDTVSLVMLGMRDGMKGPEIEEAAGLSAKEFEAAVKRMREKVRAAFPKGGRNARA